MTSSNGNIFRVTCPLWGESTGHRWIHPTRASDAELWCILSLIYASTNGWANNRDPGELRSHGAHYDITVMLARVFFSEKITALAVKPCTYECLIFIDVSLSSILCLKLYIYKTSSIVFIATIYQHLTLLSTLCMFGKRALCWWSVAQKALTIAQVSHLEYARV